MAKRKPSKGWMRGASLGIELAAGLGGFIAIGYFIDRHYGTAPKGVLIGAILGLVGGLYNMVRTALRATRSGPGSRPEGDQDSRATGSDAASSREEDGT